MGWRERLRQAAYNSPSGSRFVFDYEDVAQEVDKKTIGFVFPDADGTYVQDLGHAGRRYPLRLFIWGDDYDLQAANFDSALLERGIGKLEHPIYGVIDVVPFGTIRRRDDLKTAGNQAVIEVEFWETIGLIYPSSQDDPASGVFSSVAEFNEQSAFEFSSLSSILSTLERITLKNEYLALFDNAVGQLQLIANYPAFIRNQFYDIKNSISNSIDSLLSIGSSGGGSSGGGGGSSGDAIQAAKNKTQTLALQTVKLIQTPAKAITFASAQGTPQGSSGNNVGSLAQSSININDRLSVYESLANQVITEPRSESFPRIDNRQSNEFHVQDLYATNYLASSMLCVVNHKFSTKSEALNAADRILTQFDSLTVWRDDNFEFLEEIDTGAAYQQLQQAVALTAGFLVEISFTLKQERSIILDRNRTIIDLVAELYGGIDEFLDFFIGTNDLSGSEILELPRGRGVVYYV